MAELQKLNARHRNVARYVAVTGYSASQIAKRLGLNPDTWAQIGGCALFKEEVRRLQDEIEDAAIEETTIDPVMLELRAGALSAAKQLNYEVTSADEGSSSGTRISAANSVLDRLNYGKEETKDKNNIILFSLSQDKLDAILDPAKSTIPVPPDEIREA